MHTTTQTPSVTAYPTNRRHRQTPLHRGREPHSPAQGPRHPALHRPQRAHYTLVYACNRSDPQQTPLTHTHTPCSPPFRHQHTHSPPRARFSPLSAAPSRGGEHGAPAQGPRHPALRRSHGAQEALGARPQKMERAVSAQPCRGPRAPVSGGVQSPHHVYTRAFPPCMFLTVFMYLLSPQFLTLSPFSGSSSPNPPPPFSFGDILPELMSSKHLILCLLPPISGHYTCASIHADSFPFHSRMR